MFDQGIEEFRPPGIAVTSLGLLQEFDGFPIIGFVDGAAAGDSDPEPHRDQGFMAARQDRYSRRKSVTMSSLERSVISAGRAPVLKAPSDLSPPPEGT